MYPLPISDIMVIAVDDADENAWRVHIVDFSTEAIEIFSVEGLGHIDSAHYDIHHDIIWIITDGTIFAIERLEREIFEVPIPERQFFAYSMISEDDFLYVSGEYSNLWRISLSTLEWESLLTPEPEPPKADDEKEQTRRDQEYAVKYPPYYFGFKNGDDYLFCGALGALARVRGTSVETQRIETGARLVTGRVEGGQISLSSDSPCAEIYLGDFDAGFEVIFSDNLRALHRTAMHAGRRYIGVAEYPPSRVHNLYVLEDGDLVPVNTGCAREPSPLISLSSTGNVLWAIDADGIFRLENNTWTLIDIDDLREGIWPAPEQEE